MLLVGACTNADSIESSNTDQVTQATATSTTTTTTATSVSTGPTSTSTPGLENLVTSKNLNLEEGTGGSTTFEFQAPVPIDHEFDVKINMPIDTELDVKFVTENDMTLQIFDPVKAAGSCLDSDGRTECLLHYPALEAPTPGAWTAIVDKVSTPPAEVTITIEWHPID